VSILLLNRIYVEDAKGMVGETVTLAGWVTRTRDLRKIMFIVLRSP
jgi:aspartyl-tRNA synthetase